ncbi:nicotinamide-nucleotide adenylyltransferase [Vibrio phage BONAISHI]|nr:nicotinamide-nucleotide adenylyltransferase [Vibrio phage BONAISHI]
MKTKLAVVIMRAQQPTDAHFYLIRKALSVAEDVLVVLGSTNRSLSTVNPFYYHQRVSLIKAGLKGLEHARVQFKGSKDYVWLDDEWEGAVERTVMNHLYHIMPVAKSMSDAHKHVVLVAHKKDKSTADYVEMFPKFKKNYVAPYLVSAGNGTDDRILLNATDERRKFFVDGDVDSLYTPESVKQALRDFMDSNREQYEYVQRRYAQIATAKKPYAGLQWGIKFITADPLVVCKGHVLLGKRAAGYGEGQWCIPGGYVEQDELIDDAMTRELYEETSIDIPDPAMKNAHKGTRKFEYVGRDERGDFTTFCGLFVLHPSADGRLPKVKPQREEITEVRWVPFADLEGLAKHMFLDHYFIIEIMRRAQAINGNTL